MKITAGLPFKKTFSLPGYSAGDGWTLAGKLSNSAGTIDLATGLFSGDGEDWTLSIPAATTTGYAAGDRTLYLLATLDGEVELAYESPASIEVLGTISHNRAMVTALRALMEGRPLKAYESMTTTSGESITRLDPEKLKTWLDYYERRLGVEDRRAAGKKRIGSANYGFPNG